MLNLDHPKRVILGGLNAQISKQEAKCLGFVVMPDHVHAMVWFPQTKQLSKFMQGWKRRTSSDIQKWYRVSASNYLKTYPTGDPFWQPKYYSFEIYSENKLEEKLDYMHLNPVRAGLVDLATDWKWSSARHYLQSKPVGVPIGWVK